MATSGRSGLLYQNMTDPARLLGDLQVNRLAVGSTAAPAGNLMLVSKTANEAAGQMVSLEYVNIGDAGSSNADVSTLRVMGMSLVSGNVQQRPIESHMIKNVGLGNMAVSGIEVSIEGSIPEASAGRNHNGIRIFSISTLFPAYITNPGVRQGSGIFIGSDLEGFENGVFYEGTLSEGFPTLFKIDKVGLMTSGSHVSRGTDIYNLGAAANRWAALYTNFIVQEQNVNFAAPYWTARIDTDTGVSFPGGNRIVFSANAAAVAEFNVSGVQTEQQLVAKQITTPSAPAAGYTSIYGKSGGGVYARANGGAEKQLFDTETTGIGTTNLAANAVTNPGSTPSFTGTSTANSYSDVDSTNGKVTLTTTGGDLLVWFSGVASNTNAGVVQTEALKLDAGAEVAPITPYSYAGLAGYPVPFSIIYRFTGVAAGSHTVYARHKNTGASGTMTTVGTLIVVELKR